MHFSKGFRDVLIFLWFVVLVLTGVVALCGPEEIERQTVRQKRHNLRIQMSR